MILKEKKILSEKNEKLNLEKMDKKVTILVGIIGLLSVFNFGICKFISLGRIEYFDFDMKYYDYSLDYVSKWIWFTYVGSVIGDVVFTLLMIFLGLYLKKRNEDKPLKYEIFYLIVSTVVGGTILFFFTAHFSSIKGLGMIVGALNMEIFVAFYCTVFGFIEIKDNGYATTLTFLVITIILLILIVFGTLFLKNNEYENAMEQRTFEIIKEDVDIGGKSYQYVVISSSPERYSAYLCEIIKVKDGIELKILENAHKYFLTNEVETFQLEFSDIEYDKLSYAEIEK